MAHIVAHVGDRDPQAETFAFRSAEHRVVEILGGLSVDGDERQRAHILAPFDLGLAHTLGKGGGQRFDRFGEDIRQLVLAQRDLHLHARVRIGAQNLHDPTERFDVTIGLLDDLRDHDLTRARASQTLARDQHILADTPIFRDHEADAVLLVQPPHDAQVRSLEDFDDDALASPAFLATGFAHDGAIAMQHLAHFP